MSSFISFSSHGSSRPQMNMERHRAGNEGVYYDKEGRVYYKGKEDTSNRRATHYNGYDRNRPRSPQRDDRTYDRDRSGTGSDIDKGRDLRGYRVVGEHIYDPKQDRGRRQEHERSIDRDHRTNDRRTNGRRYDMRSLERDRYSEHGSRVSSNQGRPLPAIPREEKRRENERDRRRESWHEMNGYGSTLPRGKDKDRLFEKDSFDAYSGTFDNKGLYIPFIILGLLLVACGVMNLLFCGDYQYYFRFWVGILVFEAGVFGAVHHGDYRSGWKSVLFILSSFVAAAASLVGFAFITRHVIPETILVSDAHNFSEYARENVPKNTHSDVNNEDVVTLVCFAFDWATVGVLLGCFATLSVGVIVLDRYWNTNYYYSQVAEPFCQPALFNPFGQMQVGEAVVVLGIVTVYGCTDSGYMDYWAPVWGGSLSIFAGLAAGVAMKRHDLVAWSAGGLLLQLVAAGSLIATVVLCVLGLVKNISATDKKQSNLEEDESISSATIYAVTIAMALIAVFFAFAQMVRMVTYMCAPSQRHRRFSSDSVRSPSDIGYPYPGHDRRDNGHLSNHHHDNIRLSNHHDNSHTGNGYRSKPAARYHHNASFEPDRTFDRYSDHMDPRSYDRY